MGDKHMENVIITGADGFVGSNTVNYFLKQGVTVLALDINKHPKNLKPNSKLIYQQCDIANISNILNKIQNDSYDTFIHFAWAGVSGMDRMNYGLQIENALNTVKCLKIAKQIGCTRFICAGSIMEYEIEATVHTQGNRPGMSYVYGTGKYLAHCMCKSIAADIGIDIIWPMITNTYGIGEISPRFINATLRKIINKEPLKFTSAFQNYDFVYITDVAKAFYLIAQNGKPFCEYMIGSSNARPLKEFILELLKVNAPDIIPQFGEIPFTGTNLPLEIFDTSATEHDCGFKAEIDFAEGTKMTMDWLKSVQMIQKA